MTAASAKTLRKWFNHGFPVVDLKTGETYRATPTVPIPVNSHIRRYEGSCIDISLGQLYESDGEEAASFTYDKAQGKELRYIPEVHKYYFCDPDKEEWFIPRGSVLLFETLESVNVPMNYYCHLFQKSSLLKPFVWLSVEDAQPNYQGKIHGLIHVALPGGLTINRGAKILSLRYIKFDSSITDYYEGTAGNHVGNVISTEGKIMVGATREYIEKED